jgi:hypothetical protein
MKKTLGIISVVAVAAVLTLNVTLSKDNKTGNVNLAGISTAPEASAECTTGHYGGVGGGKCLQSANICVGDPGNTSCDFGW